MPLLPYNPIITLGGMPLKKKIILLSLFCSFILAGCGNPTSSAGSSSSSSSISTSSDYTAEDFVIMINSIKENYTLHRESPMEIGDSKITAKGVYEVIQNQVDLTTSQYGLVAMNDNYVYDFTYDKTVSLVGRVGYPEEIAPSFNLSNFISLPYFNLEGTRYVTKDFNNLMGLLYFLGDEMYIELQAADEAYFEIIDGNLRLTVTFAFFTVPTYVATFKDIGTTTAPILDEIIKANVYPTPSILSIVRRNRNGVSFYHGETVELESYVSGIIGKEIYIQDTIDGAQIGLYLDSSLTHSLKFGDKIRVKGVVAINGTLVYLNNISSITPLEENARPFSDSIEGPTYVDLLKITPEYIGILCSIDVFYSNGEIRDNTRNLVEFVFRGYDMIGTPYSIFFTIEIDARVLPQEQVNQFRTYIEGNNREVGILFDNIIFHEKNDSAFRVTESTTLSEGSREELLEDAVDRVLGGESIPLPEELVVCFDRKSENLFGLQIEFICDEMKDTYYENLLIKDGFTFCGTFEEYGDTWKMYYNEETNVGVSFVAYEYSKNQYILTLVVRRGEPVPKSNLTPALAIELVFGSNANIPVPAMDKGDMEAIITGSVSVVEMNYLLADSALSFDEYIEAVTTAGFTFLETYIDGDGSTIYVYYRASDNVIIEFCYYDYDGLPIFYFIAYFKPVGN